MKCNHSAKRYNAASDRFDCVGCPHDFDLEARMSAFYFGRQQFAPEPDEPDDYPDEAQEAPPLEEAE